MTERLTKKKKANKSKKELWSQIENNFKNEKPIECLFRVEGQRENCDLCKSSVRLTEDGFLACCNPKCSIIYKDMSGYNQQNGVIMEQKTQIIMILQDVVCQ